MKSPLSALNAVIAISAGIIVLAGYFIPGLEFLRLTIPAWASIAAGFALLVGVINLLSVHWGKVKSGQPGRVYSLVSLQKAPLHKPIPLLSPHLLYAWER